MHLGGAYTGTLTPFLNIAQKDRIRLVMQECLHHTIMKPWPAKVLSTPRATDDHLDSIGPTCRDQLQAVIR